MLRTEEEARKCWCPFARTLEGEPPGAAGVNRSGPAASYNCIASECMAWRVRDDEYETRTTDNLDRRESRPIGEPEDLSAEGWEKVREGELYYGGNAVHGNAKTIEWRRKNTNARGFCGLASPS